MRKGKLEGEGFGHYLAGFLAAKDVPRRVVVDLARIHESSLSRKINNLEGFQETEILAIGVAIGLHIGRKETQKRA